MREEVLRLLSNNEVYGLARQPDGKLLAAGAFDAVGSITLRARPGLVRFEDDGDLDAGRRWRRRPAEPDDH